MDLRWQREDKGEQAMSEERITCGQCESGPQGGARGKMCEWKCQIRSPGAKACEAYFLSSATSGLSCKRCAGPLEMADVNRRDNLCYKCKANKADSLARAMLIIYMLIAAGAAGVSVAVIGRGWGWW
jgi:hypothetical protein